MISPLSISGVPVEGIALVRDIYSDEAGVSGDPQEKVSIVVGLIVHTDTQWGPVASEMGRLVKEQVPPEYQQTFALHAKDLFNKNKYPNWPRAQRYELLKQMMRLPRYFNIPISVGVVKRGGAPPLNSVMPQWEQDHLFAFCLCMTSADSYLRGQCGSEVSRIIAEDIPRMKNFLMRAFVWLSNNSLELEDRVQGGAKIMRTFKIRKIIDHPLYADRRVSPFLQLADACAYGLKRYFGKQSYGEAYASEIITEELAKSLLPGCPEDWTRYHSVFVRDPGIPQPVGPQLLNVSYRVSFS